MKAFLSEFLGTFALVFFGTGAIVVSEEWTNVISNFGISAAFGTIVCVMIYVLGSYSGAHFNPVVTLGFALSKRFPVKNIAPYIGFQFAGGIVASLLLWFLFPENELLGSTLPKDSASQSFVIEVILTFFLVFVILIISEETHTHNKFAGIIIGLTVFLDALVGGPISGASMNPARSFAPALISGNFTHLWIYFSAPVLGAVFSVLTFRVFKK